MISFVYFDLGGVLIDDFSGNKKWRALKDELGITEESDEAFENIWQRYSKEVCIDRDVETILPVLHAELGLQFPSGYSLLGGFVNRFDENTEIRPIVDDLSNRVRLGILSNMYPGMFKAISERGIIPDSKWEIVVDSSVEKLQKPDRDIFDFAQQKANVPANEILFIENSPEHVEAARAAGWQTFLYDPSNHIKSADELQKFLSRQEFHPL